MNVILQTYYHISNRFITKRENILTLNNKIKYTNDTNGFIKDDSTHHNIHGTTSFYIY